jgi:hypothetical protein
MLSEDEGSLLVNELIEHCLYESGLTADGCWNELDDYAREAILRFAQLLIQEAVLAQELGIE